MQVRGRCRRTSTDRGPTFPAFFAQSAAPRAPVHLLTVMRTAIQFPAGNVLTAAECEIVCQEENRLIRTGGRFG